LPQPTEKGFLNVHDGNLDALLLTTTQYQIHIDEFFKT
jgi:hypothetical protein